MVRTLFTLTAAGAMVLMALAPIAPADAQGYGYDHGERGRGGYGGRGGYDDRGGYGYRGGYGRRGDDRRRGGRYGRCRDQGTGGTIIGAIAGGLLGNGVAGYGNRTAGTVLGAGAGALAGRAIDRDC